MSFLRYKYIWQIMFLIFNHPIFTLTKKLHILPSDGKAGQSAPARPNSPQARQKRGGRGGPN